MANFTVHQEGQHVQLILDGRLVLETNWQSALEIANAIRGVAKRAEEYALHAQIAYDQAILLRSGVPLGLTNNPNIQAEAVGLALYDRALRAYMPGGVKSEAVVGTPTVTQTAPNRGDTDG